MIIALLIGCAAEPPAVQAPGASLAVPADSAAPLEDTGMPPLPEDTPAPACASRTPGFLCTWAGVPGIAQLAPEGLHRLDATLYMPADLTFGPDGTPYLIDWNNHRIRVVDPDDTVRTIVGTGFLGDGIFDATNGIWTDGPALEFSLNHPSHLAFDPADPGHMYISAWHNSRVVRYAFATDEVEYRVGTGARIFGGDGGPALDAGVDLPSSVAFDDAGAMYVSDQSNQVIRRVDPDGTITTVAGVPHVIGYNGDGPALTTTLSGSFGRSADPSSRLVWRDGALYFPDANAHVIRRYDLANATITTIAGMYVPEDGVDTTGDGVPDIFLGEGGYEGDGGPAATARLNRPLDLAFGPDGTLYVADTGNHCVRAIDPDGTIRSFAGRCGEAGVAVDDLLATEGHLNTPFGVDVDAAGNVYIADTYNHVIRVVWAER